MAVVSSDEVRITPDELYWRFGTPRAKGKCSEDSSVGIYWVACGAVFLGCRLKMAVNLQNFFICHSALSRGKKEERKSFEKEEKRRRGRRSNRREGGKEAER